MKATKAQVEQRIEEVLRIRVDGAEFWDVREYAREKEKEEGSAWFVAEDGNPLSDGQLWRYIGRADKLLAESCRASRKKLFRRHLAQRRNLYAKAVSQGDVRAALATLDSEAKLLGLFAPTKTEVTGKGGAPIYPPLDALVAAVIQAEQRGDVTHAADEQSRSDTGDGTPGAGSEALPG